MRDQIVREIQRLAEHQGGRAPGSIAFAKETGISDHTWRGKFWARWSDALAEAGFAPNEFRGRLDTDFVLSKFVEVIRHYKHVPTNDEIGLYRQMHPTFPNSATFRAHFKKVELLEQLRNWLSEKAGYEDVLAMLPAKAESDRTSRLPKPVEGFVYLIRSGAHYKIGRSDELERRVKEIRVALPDSATLEHSIRTDDPPGIESYWHRRFGDKRANGEWFKLDRADVAAFKRRKYQ
jgi:Meiotically Up-regulated Gene 113 (MUG113) protein